jgi:hypothetical protein
MAAVEEVRSCWDYAYPTSRLLVGEYVGTGRFKLDMGVGAIGLCTESIFRSLQKYDNYTDHCGANIPRHVLLTGCMSERVVSNWIWERAPRSNNGLMIPIAVSHEPLRDFKLLRFYVISS